MITNERLAQLRAEREAAENAAMMQKALAATRIRTLRELGQQIAAERLNLEQMRSVRSSRGAYWHGNWLLPGMQFHNATEWNAFVEGVCEVLALVEASK